MSKENVTPPIEERVITARLIIASIVLSVLLSFVGLALPIFIIPGSFAKLGDLVAPYTTGIQSLALTFGLVSFIGVIISRIKMDPRKYALVYSTILVSTIFASGGWGSPIYHLAIVGQLGTNVGIRQNFGPYIPAWVPASETLMDMTVGGAPVPWAEWTAPLLVLWTGGLIYYFLWTSLFNIFRRQWVEIERLDFVWAQVHTMTILNVAPGEKERPSVRHLILRKRFVAGIILGAIFQLQFALNLLYPWFPAVTAAWQKWPWVSWHPGTLDFGVAIGPAWFESLPGWTGIIFGHPVGFAVCLLVPVEILLTTGIFTFIQSSVIPMILSFMGMVPKPSFPGGGSRYGYNAWFYGSALGPGNPYLGSVVSNFGAFWGLGFFTLILGGNWRYIVDTLRSVREGPSSEEREREPMPYRWAWIIFTASVVLFLVWGYGALGIGLAAGLLMLLHLGFGQLAFVRMKAAGFNTKEMWDDSIGPPFYFRVLWPPFMRLPSTFAELNAIYPDPDAVSWYGVRHLWYLKGVNLSNTDMWAATTLVETYKIGANVGIKPRDIFRSVTAASLIVMTIALPLGLWFYYTFGVKPDGIAYTWWLGGVFAGSSSIPGYAWVGTPEAVSWKVGATFLGSFLMMGALVWLRSHFVWFPLSPVGALMGMTQTSIVLGWGYTFLVTYFFKRLALRVGGVKLYEDWIVPVAVGFIVGYALGILFWGTASTVTFLYR